MGRWRTSRSPTAPYSEGPRSSRAAEELSLARAPRRAALHHHSPGLTSFRFKLVLHEVIQRGRGDRAGPRLRRDAACLPPRGGDPAPALCSQVRILETMRPQDFLGFRYHLNPASGFQSDAVPGARVRARAEGRRQSSIATCRRRGAARLEARLAAPSVSDVLRRAAGAATGLTGARRTAAPPPSGVSQAEDWRRRRAGAGIYEDAETHADLLGAVRGAHRDRRVPVLWRAHHVQMVERMRSGPAAALGAARACWATGVHAAQARLPGPVAPWRPRTSAKSPKPARVQRGNDQTSPLGRVRPGSASAWRSGGAAVVSGELTATEVGSECPPEIRQKGCRPR